MTVGSDLWTTLGSVLRLRPGAFVHELDASNAAVVAFAVVLLAGLSQAVGQSVVLFANRVKPARFSFALGIQGVLFTFGYGFLVFSTWTISVLPLSTHVEFKPS